MKLLVPLKLSTALFIAKIALPTELLMKLLVPLKPSTVLPDAYQIAAPAVVWYSPEYVAPLSCLTSEC